MFNTLKKLFTNDNQSSDMTIDQEDSVRIAMASLLVEAACADEHYDENERHIITAILAKQFDLSSEQASQLRLKGEEAQKNAVDLHRFTKDVKTLPEKDRINFIEGLWRIVLSDDVRDPFEDALIRRVCGLIHLTDKDSGEARLRVEAEK